MIINIIAYLTHLTLIPLQLISRRFTTFKTTKAQIFFGERNPDFFRQKITEAKLNLQNYKQPGLSAVYWVHVASAGELEQAIPILRTLHQKYSVCFFLTYFSPSTKAFIKNCPGLIGATSLPLEDPKSYESILVELNIRRLLLVRYDFWPMMMRVLQSTKTPIAILSATLEKARSPLPGYLQTKLKFFWFRQADLLFLVSQRDRATLEKFNFPANKIYISGDTKWQRAKERAKKAIDNSSINDDSILKNIFINLKENKDSRVIVFGSPHEEEIQIIKRCYTILNNHHFIFVAPAEIDEKNILTLLRQLESEKASLIRLSQESIHSLKLKFSEHQKIKIIILDSFGHLAELYQFADLAIVGGGFDGQLHNVLEPAAYPVITLYGNRATRAPEATTLLKHKAAIGFSNPNELFQFLGRWSSIEENQKDVVGEVIDLRATLNNARSLFSSLPDSSEVVCQALARQDRLEPI